MSVSAAQLAALQSRCRVTAAAVRRPDQCWSCGGDFWSADGIEHCRTCGAVSGDSRTELVHVAVNDAQPRLRSADPRLQGEIDRCASVDRTAAAELAIRSELVAYNQAWAQRHPPGAAVRLLPPWLVTETVTVYNEVRVAGVKRGELKKRILACIALALGRRRGIDFPVPWLCRVLQLADDRLMDAEKFLRALGTRGRFSLDVDQTATAAILLTVLRAMGLAGEIDELDAGDAAFRLQTLERVDAVLAAAEQHAVAQALVPRSKICGALLVVLESDAAWDWPRARAAAQAAGRLDLRLAAADLTTAVSTAACVRRPTLLRFGLELRLRRSVFAPALRALGLELAPLDLAPPPAVPARAPKPAPKKPAASKPAAEKPAAEKPAAKKPAASKPAAKKPAASKPAASNASLAEISA